MRRFLCAPCCLLIFLAAARPGPALADNGDATSPALSATGQAAAETVQNVWDNLIQGNLQSLADIRARADELLTRLPSLDAALDASVRDIGEEFRKLAAIAQVSRAMPAELSVVAERTRRLLENLDSQTSPLDESLTGLTARLDELAHLETEAGTPGGPAMLRFRDELNATREKITQLQNAVSRSLGPARALRDDMEAQMERMQQAMPDLWRDYYLSAAGKLFDPASWSAELTRLHNIDKVLSLRLSTEIPQAWQEWLFVLVRLLVFMVPLWVLLCLSRRPAQRAPGPLRDGWLRIVGSSAFWIVLGLGLHYAAWSNGKMFQIVASFGTMSLCWGQMTLAWDLHAFGQPEQSRVSPLWPMFLPMLVGMLLLYFDPFPLFLAAAWLAFQALILRRLHTVPRGDEGLPRLLLQGFTVVGWLSLLLTLFGFARLSILLCMGYTALAVCVQQDVALLRVGNMVDQYLPKEGGRGIVAGLLLALAVPAALIVITLTPTLWILAYPGGVYLLQHMARTGFNVGTVSFNAIQVASIFIAFYLTRSLITVGRTFMDGIRRQGVQLAPTLVGPFQTAYTYVLWALFALYVLSSLGFSLTSLTVVAGGLSVGVGFGMQNIVQNFISGLMVIFGQIIREGDVVEVSNITGTVRRVNIRSTEVETFDNATIFIPNSQFLSSSFTNWTHNGRMVRREVTVGVAYGSDMALAMTLLAQAAREHPKVLSRPEPAVFFTDFADSSLNLLLRYWVADIDHSMKTMTDIRLRINELYAEHNIDISFPQLDLHIRDQAAPADAAAQPAARETQAGRPTD
ncbi:MAG: mechanosensitive ion channel [Desulfovibrionaceae bacterium]|nr:mechanosensitive ion channel [Desulfovibrionaceae bacterium]